MINLYPLPNANNAPLGYNYANVPVRKLNEGEFDIRLDHNFSSKDSIFARFSYDQAALVRPGGSPGFAEPAPSPALRTSRITAATSRFRKRTSSPTHHQSDQRRLQPDLQPHPSFRRAAPAKPQKLGIPGANLEQCSSVPATPPA